jgi:signal peptidase I
MYILYKYFGGKGYKWIITCWIMKFFKKVWDFLQEDNWLSFLVTLGIAFILIKFLFFPGLSLLTGTELPLVIVESCSMYHHEAGLEKTFGSSVYGDYGISLGDTSNWNFQNGFSKGDVIFVVGVKNPSVGDVIIFNGGARYPLIHRVVKSGKTYATKGDNYKTNSLQLESEKNISKDQLIGKALFRIPAIGWAKLIFFELNRAPRDRGFCK